RPVRWTDSRGRSPPRRLSALRTRRQRRSNRESLAILLLLPFLAEDILAAILDTLALVGLRLPPAANLGRKLAYLLLVDPGNLDRCLVGGLYLKTFRHLDIDIMAVAKLKLEPVALSLRTIANAGNFQHLAETVGHALDQVRHQRALHAPERARLPAVIRGIDRDRAVLDLVVDKVGKPHGK